MGFDIQTIFDVSNELEYRLKKDKNIEIIREIVERIESAIDREVSRTGKMGTESVDITLSMTNEELEIFKDIDLFNDNEHYLWEIEGNDLHITYTEEV